MANTEYISRHTGQQIDDAIDAVADKAPKSVTIPISTKGFNTNIRVNQVVEGSALVDAIIEAASTGAKVTLKAGDFYGNITSYLTSNLSGVQIKAFTVDSAYLTDEDIQRVVTTADLTAAPYDETVMFIYSSATNKTVSLYQSDLSLIEAIDALNDALQGHETRIINLAETVNSLASDVQTQEASIKDLVETTDILDNAVQDHETRLISLAETADSLTNRVQSNEASITDLVEITDTLTTTSENHDNRLVALENKSLQTIEATQVYTYNAQPNAFVRLNNANGLTQLTVNYTNTDSETEFMFKTAASSSPSVTFTGFTPKFADGIAPTFRAGHTYEVSILDSCVLVSEF